MKRNCERNAKTKKGRDMIDRCEYESRQLIKTISRDGNENVFISNGGKWRKGNRSRYSIQQTPPNIPRTATIIIIVQRPLRQYCVPVRPSASPPCSKQLWPPAMELFRRFNVRSKLPSVGGAARPSFL